MIEPVYIDTSGWIAAASSKEAHHAEVARAFDEQLSAGITFVTSNLVLAEMHALTVRARGAKIGCTLIDAIYADPRFRVISVDRDLEARAAEKWLRRSDVPFSLTDAVSFQIMKEEHMTKAFALDHHFEAAGFVLVPSRQQRAQKRKRW